MTTGSPHDDIIQAVAMGETPRIYMSKMNAMLDSIALWRASTPYADGSFFALRHVSSNDYKISGELRFEELIYGWGKYV